jgi:streptothricin acetyltransferase
MRSARDVPTQSVGTRKDIIIRPLTLADIPRLSEIDGEFESDCFLDVEKTAPGFEVMWRLVERPLIPPFRSTDYSFDENECNEIGARLRNGDGLWLVAQDAQTGRLAALLDVEREGWHHAARLWNIAIDRRYRRQGLGRELVRRALAWARSENLRAVWLETQTNNLPACRFYQAMGFMLCGIDDHFYSNSDIGLNEVAIFWWYELDFPSPVEYPRRGKGPGDGGVT